MPLRRKQNSKLGACKGPEVRSQSQDMQDIRVIRQWVRYRKTIKEGRSQNHRNRKKPKDRRCEASGRK